MVAPTAADIAACARLGFEKETVYRSRLWIDLGARSGHSDESRLLRWISIEEERVRQSCEQPPRLHEYFFDEEKMQSLIKVRIAEVVAEMNARARQLAASTQ